MNPSTTTNSTPLLTTLKHEMHATSGVGPGCRWICLIHYLDQNQNINMGKPAHHRRFPFTLPEAEFTISFSSKTNFYFIHLFIYYSLGASSVFILPAALWYCARK